MRPIIFLLLLGCLLVMTDRNALDDDATRPYASGRLSDSIEDRRSWWEPAATVSAFLSNLGAQRTSEYVDHFFGPKASPPHNYPYDPNGLLPGPREGVNPDLGMPTLVDELAAYYGPEAVHRYNNVRWHQLGKLLNIQRQLETLPSRTGLPFPPDPYKP